MSIHKPGAASPVSFVLITNVVIMFLHDTMDRLLGNDGCMGNTNVSYNPDFFHMKWQFAAKFFGF